MRDRVRAANQRRAARFPRTYRVVSGQVRPVQTAAGVVLGGVAYALFLNYLRGGMPQAKGWVLAKLINKPMAGASIPNARPGEPRGTQ
jgi:hypothetical protein